MNFAYGWAFSKPVRKVYYNITITGAVGRGRADHRHHRAGLDPDRQAGHHHRAARRRSASLDLNYVGYAIVGLFVLTWVVALAVWRFGADRGEVDRQPAGHPPPGGRLIGE